VNFVSPGFFATLKIPLYAGRDFSERDATSAPKVAVVNQKFARYYFGDGAAVGRHIGMGADPGTKTDIEIIGVVGDTKYQTLREPMPRQVFFPYLQESWVDQMTAYVRTDLSTSSMFPVLRGTVRKLGGDLPVYMMKTGELAARRLRLGREACLHTRRRIWRARDRARRHRPLWCDGFPGCAPHP